VEAVVFHDFYVEFVDPVVDVGGSSRKWSSAGTRRRAHPSPFVYISTLLVRVV
jgi:hypothetical protein